jgi:protease-4
VAGVGSIGAIYVHQDDSAKREKEGISEEVIVSEGSEDKVIYGGYAGMTDELRAEIKSMLGASRREFVGYVRRGRAGKLANDSALTGRNYRGKDAIDLGLVDRVGTLDEAIKRARKLA